MNCLMGLVGLKHSTDQCRKTKQKQRDSNYKTEILLARMKFRRFRMNTKKSYSRILKETGISLMTIEPIN